MGDAIHRPDHYCYSKYEPKDVIHEWGLNFNLGSAVKYIARAGRKDDILQDLEKAREFLTFEIEAIKEARPDDEIAKAFGLNINKEEQESKEDFSKKTEEELFTIIDESDEFRKNAACAELIRRVAHADVNKDCEIHFVISKGDIHD